MKPRALLGNTVDGVRSSESSGDNSGSEDLETSTHGAVVTTANSSTELQEVSSGAEILADEDPEREERQEGRPLRKRIRVSARQTSR